MSSNQTTTTTLFGETPDWVITVTKKSEIKNVIELFGENFHNVIAIHICLIPLLTNDTGLAVNYPQKPKDADSIAFQLCEEKIKPVPKDLYRLHSGLFSYLTCPLYRHICDVVGKIDKANNRKQSQISSENFYQNDFSNSINVLLKNKKKPIWDFLNVYINIQQNNRQRIQLIYSSFLRKIPTYERKEGPPPKEPLYISFYSNSCYMDSVIQCLYWTNGFPTKLLTAQELINTPERKINPDKEKKINIANKFIDVIYAYHNSDEEGLQIAKIHLKIAYSKMTGIGGGQQDAHEFLVNLLDYLEKKFSPKLIEDFFTFELQKRLVYEQKSENDRQLGASVTTEFQKMLPLQIKSGDNTLENQIDEFFKEEEVEYKPSSSNSAKQGFIIQKSSPNLIIQLKRFAYQFDTPIIIQQNAQNQSSQQNQTFQVTQNQISTQRNGQQNQDSALRNDQQNDSRQQKNNQNQDSALRNDQQNDSRQQKDNQNQNSRQQKDNQNQISTHQNGQQKKGSRKSTTTTKNKTPGGTIKIDTPIEIPEILDLTRHTINNEDLQYELYGFIHHEGESTSDGHYINYVKVIDTWYFIDDRNDKTPVKMTDHELYNYYLSTSYLLFYRRVETAGSK